MENGPSTHEWLITNIENITDLRKWHLNIAEGILDGLILRMSLRRQLLLDQVNQGAPKSGNEYVDGFNAGILIAHEHEAKVLEEMLQRMSDIKIDLRKSRGQ